MIHPQWQEITEDMIRNFLSRFLAFASGIPIAIVALVYAGSVIYGRIENLEYFAVSVWGDRDLWRGLWIFTHWEGQGTKSTAVTSFALRSRQ